MNANGSKNSSSLGFYGAYLMADDPKGSLSRPLPPLERVMKRSEPCKISPGTKQTMIRSIVNS